MEKILLKLSLSEFSDSTKAKKASVAAFEPKVAWNSLS